MTNKQSTKAPLSVYLIAIESKMLLQCSWSLLAVIILLVDGVASVAENYEVQHTKNKVSRSIIKSNSTGGEGGEAFDDFEDGNLLSSLAGIHSMVISYDDKFVESLQVTYLLSNGSHYKAPRHGGNSSSIQPAHIDFVSSDFIAKVKGMFSSDYVVDQLAITTIRPKDIAVKNFGPYGGSGPANFSYEGYIVGFHGRSGDFLDKIGIYNLAPVKKSEMKGGGNYYSFEFDENPDKIYPPVVKITKIFMRHSGYLYSIQAEYQLMGGRRYLGKMHGTKGGTLTVIKFDSDEELIRLEGKGTYTDICQVTFVSKKGDGSTMYYGPFGADCIQNVTFDGHIVGFYGSLATNYINGTVIDGIGVYYVE